MMVYFNRLLLSEAFKSLISVFKQLQARMDDTSTSKMEVEQILKAYEASVDEVKNLKNRILQLESHLHVLKSLVPSKERNQDKNISSSLKLEGTMRNNASTFGQNLNGKSLQKLLKPKKNASRSQRPMKLGPREILIKKLKRQYERKCQKDKASLELFLNEVTSKVSSQKTEFDSSVSIADYEETYKKDNLINEKKSYLIDKMCQKDFKCLSPIKSPGSKEMCGSPISSEDSCGTENQFYENIKSTLYEKNNRKKNYESNTLDLSRSNSSIFKELYICTEKMCSIIPRLSPINSPVSFKETVEGDSVDKMDWSKTLLTPSTEENKSSKNTKQFKFSVDMYQTKDDNSIIIPVTSLTGNEKNCSLKKESIISLDTDKDKKLEQREPSIEKYSTELNSEITLKRKPLSDYIKTINSLTTTVKSVPLFEANKRCKTSPSREYNFRKEKYFRYKSSTQEKSKTTTKLSLSHLKKSSSNYLVSNNLQNITNTDLFSVKRLSIGRDSNDFIDSSDDTEDSCSSLAVDQGLQKTTCKNAVLSNENCSISANSSIPCFTFSDSGLLSKNKSSDDDSFCLVSNDTEVCDSQARSQLSDYSCANLSIPCITVTDLKSHSENQSFDMDHSDSSLTNSKTINEKEEKHYFSENILSMPFIGVDDFQPINKSSDNIQLSSNTLSSEKWVDEKQNDIAVSSVNKEINTDQNSNEQNNANLLEIERKKVSPSNNELNVTINYEKAAPRPKEESMMLDCKVAVLKPNVKLLRLSKETYDVMRKSKNLKVIVEDCLKSLSKQKNIQIDHENDMLVDKKLNPFMIPDVEDSIFEGTTTNEKEDFFDEYMLKYNYKLNREKINAPQRLRKCMPDSIPKSIVYFLNCILERTIFTSYNFDLRVKDLTAKLTSPSYSTNSKDIIFYILKYLSLMNTNPFQFYDELKDPSLFLPPLEKCIASSLLRINSQSKAYYEDFLSNVIVNIRQIILGIPTLPPENVCVLCRVLTYICLTAKRKQEPIILCCELLKMRHKYFPMLVACIAVVWKELFHLSANSKREEIIFYGTIEYAIQNWTRIKSLVYRYNYCKGLTRQEYNTCVDVLKRLISLPKIKINEELVDLLIYLINEKCSNNECFEEYLFSTPLVLSTAFKGWEWAKCNIIDKHILPSISKYGSIDKNEKALTFFLKLYAEILLFEPEDKKPEKSFLKLFEGNGEDIVSDCEVSFPKLKTGEGLENIQGSFAMCAIHLILSKNQRLPDTLRSWVKNNENNPKFPDLRYICHRGILRAKGDFKKEDIID